VWCLACPDGHVRKFWSDWTSRLREEILKVIGTRRLARRRPLGEEQLHRFVIETTTRRLAGKDAPDDTVTAVVRARAFRDPRHGTWLVTVQVDSDISDALIVAFEEAGLTH
jgi:hypothetical protein